jgi:4-hydroxybutyryl-CoA dehydratase/vinylacetyl-CoA-Delta-isomerase
MPLMTKDQYIESLKKLNLKVYMFGKPVKNLTDNPIIKPSMNSVALTYDMAQKKEYEDLMLAKSSISGEVINRFTHLHQSSDDLVKKVKMQRMLGQSCAACFQRCVGLDAGNALFALLSKSMRNMEPDTTRIF